MTVGHNMGGVFVLFSGHVDGIGALSWHLSPDEARTLGAALMAEAGRLSSTSERLTLASTGGTPVRWSSRRWRTRSSSALKR